MFWLNNRPRDWRVSFQHQLFTTIIKSAALCECYFLEANDWQSYVVLNQPGVDPESLVNGIRAGMIGVFWAVGWSGFKVPTRVGMLRNHLTW